MLQLHPTPLPGGAIPELAQCMQLIQKHLRLTPLSPFTLQPSSPLGRAAQSALFNPGGVGPA